MLMTQTATGKTRDVAPVDAEWYLRHGWTAETTTATAPVPVPGHTDSPDPMPVGGIPVGTPETAPSPSVASADEPEPAEYVEDTEESHSFPEKKTSRFGRRSRKG